MNPQTFELPDAWKNYEATEEKEKELMALPPNQWPPVHVIGKVVQREEDVQTVLIAKKNNIPTIPIVIDKGE